MKYPRGSECEDRLCSKLVLSTLQLKARHIERKDGPVDSKGPFEIILELLLVPLRELAVMLERESSGVGVGDKENRKGRAEG